MRGRLQSMAVALCLVTGAASSQATDRRVEVDADQTTTVVGSFDSLAGVLTDLCQRARVDLRSFDAPDRPIVVEQVKRPLADVIARLLARENYLLGVRGGDPGGRSATIAWLRVTGARQSGAAALGGGLAVPSKLGGKVFEDESAADTGRAQQAVADWLMADETRVAHFLQTDTDELAGSLRHYPHIDRLLRQMRAVQRDPAVLRKLDAVIDELASPTGSGHD